MDGERLAYETRVTLDGVPGRIVSVVAYDLERDDWTYAIEDDAGDVRIAARRRLVVEG